MKKKRFKSRFYREARFYNSSEVIGLLKKAGFSDIVCAQTLFGNNLAHMDTAVKKGGGEEGFVALRACKGRL